MVNNCVYALLEKLLGLTQGWMFARDITKVNQ